MGNLPDPLMTNILTFGFIALVIYFAYTNKNKPTIFNSDMIDILYEVAPPAQTVQFAIKKKKKKKKLITQQEQQPIEEQPIECPIEEKIEAVKIPLVAKEFTEIHHDCVNALMSLGMKKRESVNTVIRIFNKYEVNSIEDFIKKAFVPDEYYRSST